MSTPDRSSTAHHKLWMWDHRDRSPVSRTPGLESPFYYLEQTEHLSLTEKYNESHPLYWVVKLPNPGFAGTSRAGILAWMSSDARGVPFAQAVTWTVSRTHSGRGQQSMSVSFSPHRRRFLSSRSWTRITVCKAHTSKRKTDAYIMTSDISTDWVVCPLQLPLPSALSHSFQ